MEDTGVLFRLSVGPPLHPSHDLGEFDDEREHTIKLPLGRTKALVLKLERIIVSKKAPGREKDKLVLGALSDTLRAIRGRE